MPFCVEQKKPLKILSGQIDDEPHVFSMGFIVLATEGRDRDIFLKSHHQ
ncbi:hypothetical protein [Proteus mirabilis]